MGISAGTLLTMNLVPQPRPEPLAALALCLLAPWSLQAEVIQLAPDQDMIGHAGQTTAEQQDMLPDIARRYHLGFDEIGLANPGVDTWIPGAGTQVRLRCSISCRMCRAAASS